MGYKNHINDWERALEYIKMLEANQVDGIISKSYLKYTISSYHFDRNLSPWEISDNYAGGACSRNLVKTGARKIIMIVRNDKATLQQACVMRVLHGSTWSSWSLMFPVILKENKIKQI